MARITAELTADHARLHALLERARSVATLDLAAYAEFRAGLLRHIGIEEKILLRAVRSGASTVPIEQLHRLRVEHAALTSLLVPTPDLALLAEIAGLLATHDAREEGAEGVYARCERALGDRSDELAARARAYPKVPVAKHYDGHGALRTAREALASAERISRVRGAPT